MASATHCPHTPDKPFSFGVKYNGKRAVFQIDFSKRIFQVFQRGLLVKSTNFREYLDFCFESSSLTIIFTEDKIDVELDDEHDILYLSFFVQAARKIAASRGSSKGKFSDLAIKLFSTSTPINLPSMTIIKEGIIEKRGNTKLPSWNARLVQIRMGEITYCRVGAESPLGVVRLWKETTTCEAVSKNLFKVTVSNRDTRTYQFRITGTGEKELDEWLSALSKAVVDMDSVERHNRDGSPDEI